MIYKENRGSEWRKWDLHIHTPESGMANEFEKNWDQYVISLFTTAIQQEVAVLGITDYFTIDGYKKLKEEYLNNDTKLQELFGGDEQLIQKVKAICVLPNIEFRLNNLVNGNRINYHVIFSDKISIKDIEENFLHEIDFVYEQEPNRTAEKRKLKRVNIEELGRKIHNEQETFSGTDFEIGCTVAVVDDQQIHDILINKKSIFQNNYIICIPVDEDLSKISWNGQGHVVRKGYYQHCHAFFATNPKTIEFGLGKLHPTKESFLEEFKSLKPSVCGVDAHSCHDIEHWLGQSVTIYDSHNPLKINIQKKILWIKANPTFDGLRQILFEPESRVKIQTSKPEPKPDRMVISSIEFESDESLMGTQKILLNDNLNAIIGGKSSGKSLLLHSIAEAIDPEQVEKISRMLGFDGYRNSFDYNLKVQWKNGDIDSFRHRDDVTRKITYIPQLYINYLAERNNKNDLNKLIINILNQNQEFRTYYCAQQEKITSTANDINTFCLNLIETRKKLIELTNKLKEVGYEAAIIKSVRDFEKRIETLMKDIQLSPEESSAHAKLSKLIDTKEKAKKSLLIQIEVTTKIISEIDKYSVKLCGEKGSETTGICKGSIDAILDQYIDLPTEVISLKDEISEYLERLKSDLKHKIQSLKLVEQIQVLNDEINFAKGQHKPIVEKLENQIELSKLQEQYKNEQARLETSKLIKKQYDVTLNDFKKIKIEIANLLQKRYDLYLNIIEEINSKYSKIHDDICLSASLKFQGEKFQFYHQINKTKINRDHPFNNIFKSYPTVNYSEIPNIFRNMKGVSTDFNLKVISPNTDILFPLNQNISIEDIYRGLIEDYFKF